MAAAVATAADHPLVMSDCNRQDLRVSPNVHRHPEALVSQTAGSAVIGWIARVRHFERPGPSSTRWEAARMGIDLSGPLPSKP